MKFCVILLILPILVISNNHHYSWTYELANAVKVTTKDGVESDRHGKGLALCGDVAVVGSYADTFKSVQSGSAYVYRTSHVGSLVVEEKLFPSLGGDDDFFGWSISCYENYTFIGAYGDDLFNTDAGAVYMYEYVHGKWEEIAIFYSSAPAKNEHFGYSIDYHDDILVVGAPGNKALYTQCGAVYTYRRVGQDEDPQSGFNDDGAIPPPTGWTLEAILVPEDASPYMNFGWSLSMKYEYLIIGAPLADLRAGAAYIYARNVSSTDYYDDMYYQFKNAQYELLTRVQSPFPRPKTFFGCSVAMGRNVAVIGQYMAISYRDGQGDQMVLSGGAFVFKRGELNTIGEGAPKEYEETWGAVIELSSLVGVSDYGFFGYSVSISNNVIVVGAPGDGEINTNATVHIFQSNDDTNIQWHHTVSWGAKEVDKAEYALQDKLYSRVGIAVTATRGRLLVGDTNGLNANGVRSGCAYAIDGKFLSTSHNEPNEHWSESSEWGLPWLLVLIIPVVVCCAGCYHLRKREHDALENLMCDGSSAKGFNEMSTRSGSDISGSIAERVTKWFQPLSTHSELDWFRQEMEPIRLSGDSSSHLSTVTGLDDEESSSGHSKRGLMAIFTKLSSQRAPSSSSSKMAGELERDPKPHRNMSNSRHVLATAQAIADDDNHPNQAEAAELIRTYERDWISEERFIREVKRLFT